MGGNFPLLHEVMFSTDDSVALRNADYVILLGAYPQNEHEHERVMKQNFLIFSILGNAIQAHASRNCKVVIVQSPANTNALICAGSTDLPKENFTTLARLDQNRAAWQIAQLAKVPVDSV